MLGETPGFVGQCFYNLTPGSLEAPHYQPSAANPTRIEGFDTAEYVRLVQQYGNGNSCPAAPSPRRHHKQPRVVEGGGGAGGARELCERSSFAYSSKSSDNSDGESSLTNCSRANSPDEGGFARVDWIGSSCAVDRSAQSYASAGKLTSRIGVHGFPCRDRFQLRTASSSQSELTEESVPTTSSSMGCDSYPPPHRPPSRAELRKVQGGSLKIPRRRELHNANGIRHYQRAALRSDRLSSGSNSTTADREPIGDDCHSNPSSNVILSATTTPQIAAEARTSTTRCEDDCAQRSEQQQHYQHHHPHRHVQRQRLFAAPFAISECGSTNSNLESKRKLDRSRSLD